MPITLRNGPIVELIAEVRWNTESQPLPGPHAPGAPSGIIANASTHEEFFMRFAGHVFSLGFQQLERLIPPGYPIFAGHPVFRFRSTSKPHVLYQVGAGFFSANAVPPYKTWTDFAPVIEAGLHALIQSRHANEKEAPFSPVILRYIDAFKPVLTQGRDIASFMSDVLGIKVDLPTGIAKHIARDQKAKPSLQLQIPMANGMSMHLAIGEGIAQNELAYVMDTNVTSEVPISANADDVMKTLHSARDVIHEMFFDITSPIAALMDPHEEP